MEERSDDNSKNLSSSSPPPPDSSPPVELMTEELPDTTTATSPSQPDESEFPTNKEDQQASESIAAKSDPESDPESAPKAEPELESKQEPKPEPKPEPEPETKPETDPVPEPEPEPVAASNDKAEPNGEEAAAEEDEETTATITEEEEATPHDPKEKYEQDDLKLEEEEQQQEEVDQATEGIEPESMEPATVINDNDDTSETLPSEKSNASYPLRIEAHLKLRCYESRRRKAYRSKLSSSTLYWRCFRELIHHSLAETKRAEQMVRAQIVANKNYSDHVKAIAENSLNKEDFMPLQVSEKKEKSGVSLFSSSSSSKLSTNLRSLGKKSTDNKLPNQNDDSNPTNEFKLGDLDAVDPLSHHSLLNSFLESQSVLANRYEEYAQSIQESVAKELISLRLQLQKQVNHMEALGNAVLAQANAAEQEVVLTWGRFIRNDV